MKKQKQPLYVIGFIVYLILLIKFLVLKQPLVDIKNALINISLKDLWERLSLTQWLPFKLIVHGYNHQTMASFFRGIGQNLIWLIPGGFFLPLWYKKHKLGSIIVVGMIVGLLIEVFSFLAMGYPLRVDAVILAGLGSSIGYGLYRLL